MSRRPQLAASLALLLSLSPMTTEPLTTRETQYEWISKKSQAKKTPKNTKRNQKSPRHHRHHLTISSQPEKLT
jgi:hypothetical protein